MSRAVRTVAALGECMIELSGEPLRRRFGGDTLNTALYLARLTRGGLPAVRYVTALGTDSLSDELIAAWQAEGVDTAQVQRLPAKRPGLYLIETDARGARRFHYWRDDSAARHYFAGDVDWTALLKDIDWLHLSGITLALFPAPQRQRLSHALAQFVRDGGRISFDNNFRAVLWSTVGSAAEVQSSYRDVLSLSEVALLTADDEQAVWGEHEPARMIERTLSLGCREVVIKQGSQMAFARRANEQVSVLPETVAHVVDTSAAGDAFAAAYLAARWRDAGLADALRCGHRLAAAVVQYPGAIIPREAMPDVFSFLKSTASDSTVGANDRASFKELS